MPKSFFGPPGLWLAVRMMPPLILRPSLYLRARMRCESAGVLRRPSLATISLRTCNRARRASNGGASEATNAVGRGDFYANVDDLRTQIAAVAAEHEHRADFLGAQAAFEDTLDEVFGVVFLLKIRHLKTRLETRKCGRRLTRFRRPLVPGF